MQEKNPNNALLSKQASECVCWLVQQYKSTRARSARAIFFRSRLPAGQPPALPKSGKAHRIRSFLLRSSSFFLLLLLPLPSSSFFLPVLPFIRPPQRCWGVRREGVRLSDVVGSAGSLLGRDLGTSTLGDTGGDLGRLLHRGSQGILAPRSS